uniref:Aminotransferase-like plant mobile domain-containing protein n=1 Tax=Oryza glumipatula TaxID=40148 RepID=A0A0D9Z9M1_9ORYZ
MAGTEELLVQESTVPIVSDGDPSRPAVRSAHFLLPRAAAGGRPPPLPSSPLCSGGPVPDHHGLLRVVEFKGWAGSPGLWRQWVDRLRPRHEPLWRSVGILDAILATAYRVRRDEGTLLQLAAFWSADTNTFMFPWGEATVTLEDMTVLAGLPLFGKPVRARLLDALVGDVDALMAVRSALHRSKYKKPSYPGWVQYFLKRQEEEDDETAASAGADLIEHGAFLAMWLSLFVFAAPPFDVVGPQVFPIAARLARGIRVALAPAALAGIYGDLSALKRFLDLRDREEALQVTAPMHILLLWVWERFPQLRPAMATTTTPATTDACRVPMAARWHGVHKALDPQFVHGVFMSPDKFEWRPYGSRSIALPPKEAKAGTWVVQDVMTSNTLLSFTRCLRQCELVGMGCIEQYNPHRVARQFGFDQDVPGTIARANSNWKVAWRTYTFGYRKFALVVPHYKLGVTLEYARWWEPYSLACSTDVSNYANTREPHSLFIPMKRNTEELSGANSCKKQHVDTSVPLPGTMEDPLDEIPLIERLNNIIMVQCARQEQIADVVKYSVPEFIRGKDNSMIVQQDAEQYLSDSMRVLDSSADESFCGSVTKMEQHISLLQSKQKAQDHASAYEANNCNSGQVMIHHGVESAASTGSNEAIEAATTAGMLPTPEDILVTSDEVMMERNCGYELDAVLLGAAPQQQSTEDMGTCMFALERDNRAKTDKDELASLKGTEKENEDDSTSNQAAAGSLIEDCIEISRKNSGNNGISSDILVNASTELVRTKVSTKTLYYLTKIWLLKNAHERDASDMNRDHGVYQPRREVGTREMIEKSFAAREAQKVELERVIKHLKEQLRDRYPSKLDV